MVTTALEAKQQAVATERPEIVAHAAGAAIAAPDALFIYPYDADVFSLTEPCVLGEPPSAARVQAMVADARVKAQLQLAKEAYERSEFRHENIDAKAVRIPMPGGVPPGAVELVHAAGYFAENNVGQALLVGALAASKTRMRRRIELVRHGYLEPIANPKYWRNILLNSAVARARDLKITLKQLTLKEGQHLHVGAFSVEQGDKGIALAELWAKTLEQLGITKVSLGNAASLPEHLKEIPAAIERVLRGAS